LPSATTTPAEVSAPAGRMICWHRASNEPVKSCEFISLTMLSWQMVHTIVTTSKAKS